MVIIDYNISQLLKSLEPEKSIILIGCNTVYHWYSVPASVLASRLQHRCCQMSLKAYMKGKNMKSHYNRNHSNFIIQCKLEISEISEICVSGIALHNASVQRH